MLQCISSTTSKVKISLVGQRRLLAPIITSGGQQHNQQIIFTMARCKTTWQRAAIRVKNTEYDKDNPYLDLIRDTHDPSMHLKTIEDELKGTIGKALGKQGEKILYFIRLMQQSHEEYQQAACNIKQQAVAEQYNEYRKQAIQARWELLVHRQAAGFIVNNHKTVHEHYRIPDALPTCDGTDNATVDQSQMKRAASEDDAVGKKVKKFGDQLDWWQRIGRWR